MPGRPERTKHELTPAATACVHSDAAMAAEARCVVTSEDEHAVSARGNTERFSPLPSPNRCAHVQA